MIEINNLETKLDKDGFIVSDIKGVSMLPLLKQGIDRVIVSKVTKPLNKYDVVLYKVKNNYVLHRIIDISGEKLTIRGDNCFNNEYVHKKDVLGILTAFYHKNGYIEITDSFNKKCYYRAKIKYLLRKIKHCIK